MLALPGGDEASQAILKPGVNTSGSPGPPGPSGGFVHGDLCVVPGGFLYTPVLPGLRF